MDLYFQWKNSNTFEDYLMNTKPLASTVTLHLKNSAFTSTWRISPEKNSYGRVNTPEIRLNFPAQLPCVVIPDSEVTRPI